MADRPAKFLPQEVIRQKRDARALPAEDIAEFVAGSVSGHVSGEQVSAFLMAAFLNGLDRDETVALTQAMMRSGSRLEWPDMEGPVVDKHSTGGVGDVVSLMLAPAVSACGGFVPMISGRGLGHTGGTLDKLESIPGYDTRPTPERLRAVVREAGCAIVGQTDDLAPADRLFYGIRDVTATVESIPLITASILSKKLAAGLGFLVMDVKVGNGAFMPDRDGARALARSLVEVANGAGLPTSALLTDMDQPLAPCAGNALEVLHAVDYLTGRFRDPRLHAVVVGLGGEMLRLAGLAPSAEAGETRIEKVLDNGEAAQRFGRMVAALGGPASFLERAETILPKAPVVLPVVPRLSGTISYIDTRAVGLGVVALGGGRTRAADAIDPRVGFSNLRPLGAEVGLETPIGLVHAATSEEAAIGARALLAAYTISDGSPAARPPIIERLDLVP